MKIKSKRFIAPTWSVLVRVGLGGRSHRRSGSLLLSHQDREVLRQSCGLLLRESAKILDCPLRYAASSILRTPTHTFRVCCFGARAKDLNAGSGEFLYPRKRRRQLLSVQRALLNDFCDAFVAGGNPQHDGSRFTGFHFVGNRAHFLGAETPKFWIVQFARWHRSTVTAWSPPYLPVPLGR